MKTILLKHLKDCSDEKSFCFYIECKECENKWKSKRKLFSKANIIPPTKEKAIVYAVLYEKEKEFAVAQAIEEAKKEFNICPVCGKLVCNDCFLICEDIDMCLNCARVLKEKGEFIEKKGIRLNKVIHCLSS